jgi:Flp pilus assembly pilin Flp
LDYFKTFLASKGILASQEKGQGLVEYAILIILIAGIAVLVVPGLVTKIQTLFNSIQFTVPAP